MPDDIENGFVDDDNDFDDEEEGADMDSWATLEGAASLLDSVSMLKGYTGAEDATFRKYIWNAVVDFLNMPIDDEDCAPSYRQMAFFLVGYADGWHDGQRNIMRELAPAIKKAHAMTKIRPK